MLVMRTKPHPPTFRPWFGPTPQTEPCSPQLLPSSSELAIAPHGLDFSLLWLPNGRKPSHLSQDCRVTTISTGVHRFYQGQGQKNAKYLKNTRSAMLHRGTVYGRKCQSMVFAMGIRVWFPKNGKQC